MVRGYTILEQSQKLAEILPIESADLIYIMYRNGEKPRNGDANLSTVYESNEHKWYWIDIRDESWDMRIGEDIPCWSFTALLSVLPRVDIEKETRSDDAYDYRVKAYIGDGYVGDWFDNPIDACYDMIIELHEDKLL